MSPPTLATSMRWSTVSVIGREVTRTLFTIVLARLIGPEDFGIVAQALVYVGLTSLLLDQGFSTALIQRDHLERRAPGAVVTVNGLIGLTLAALTLLIAPAWAQFMHTPELTRVLLAFAPVLLLRSLAITPRAMLIRSMDFRTIGIIDITSALCGGACGIAVALAGGGYWALLAQVLATDVAYLAGLAATRSTIVPNLHLRAIASIVGFSARAFLTGILLNSVSRNIDNLLVGRFQGAQALAFYGLAYRLLLFPVQLALTTVATVLLPAFSRMSGNLRALNAEVSRTTRVAGVVALPAMSLVAAAAPQLVEVIFGSAWLPAIPLVQVLALAGALQAIYQATTPPLVLSLGRDRLALRFAWLTTGVTLVGVVAGLPFGPFGVAVGYTMATAALTPVEWAIRHRLLGTGIRDQITPLLPACHVALWVAASYLVPAVAIPGHDLTVLAAGVPLALSVGAVVLRVAHRTLLAETLQLSRKMVAGGSQTPTEAEPRES